MALKLPPLDMGITPLASREAQLRQSLDRFEWMGSLLLLVLVKDGVLNKDAQISAAELMLAAKEYLDTEKP